MDLTQLLLLLLVGMAAGLVSGALGVGGGIILIPALVFIFGLSQHAAQGTSLAILLPPTGILAAITYHKHGFIHWKYALVITTVYVIGAWLGSKFAIELPARTMRKVFALFLVIVGAKLFFSK